MVLLTARDVLELWERGRIKPPVERVLDLLAAAYPELSPEELQELPVGRRDQRLLAVREVLFGRRLNCLTACPACGERLELTFDIAQLQMQPPEPIATQTHSLTIGDCEIHFRLPNSADLSRLSELSDAAEARRSLFEMCLQDARREGAPILPAELPEEIIDAVADRMAEIDPQADMQIALSCPACSQDWSTTFDIVSYLWIEINAWAMRLFHEIHRLASAYGWNESEILALSPVRRRLFLELIG